MTQQPWLEWQSDTRKFVPKLGSPAVRIAGHIQQEQGANYLTLHRGTNVTYAAKEKALAAVHKYSFGKFGGIFTMPWFEGAKDWAFPVVLSAKIEPAEFLKAVTVANPEKGNVSSIYVGIEAGYPEIAFLYAPGDKFNLFFDSLTATCVTSRAQGADVKFAPPCK